MPGGAATDISSTNTKIAVYLAMQPDNSTLLPSPNTNNYPTNKIKNTNNNNKKPIIPQPRSHAGTAAQACAACKHQRRKCTPDCVLAPYFPHDRQRQFLNAHRLFGVSNIVKIVKHLQPPAKDHAMRTIIFQSDARAADPVGGCYRIIRDLEQQISFAKAELDFVLHHLAICRHQAAAAEGRESKIGWDVLESYDNEKWRGQFGAAVVEDDGVNSWGCMGGGNNQVHANAESTSSSLPNHHLRKVSLEERNGGMINGNLDRLSLIDDDTKGGEFKFDLE